jgi:hypothetical protein
MKILLGFFIGTTFCLLLVVTLFHNSFFAAADTSAATASVDNSAVTSSDGTDSSLLPDVKKIYDVALGAPYRQVESEITDPDIANFYRRYMDETGLDKIGLDENP